MFIPQGRRLPLWLTFGVPVHTGDRGLLVLMAISYTGLLVGLIAGIKLAPH